MEDVENPSRHDQTFYSTLHDWIPYRILPLESWVLDYHFHRFTLFPAANAVEELRQENLNRCVLAQAITAPAQRAAQILERFAK